MFSSAWNSLYPGAVKLSVDGFPCEKSVDRFTEYMAGFFGFIANILFSSEEIQRLVTAMEVLIIGVVFLVAVYILSSKQPKKASRNLFLYVLAMALIFYAIFYLKDPLEFIPQEVWNVANYVIIVATIYGFYRQIIGGFRAEFNDRLNDFRGEVTKRLDDFKTDMCRDFDKIEKRLDKIDEAIKELRT